MSGTQENDELLKPGVCAICGGTTAWGSSNMPFSIGTGVLLIKDVPALVCGDCGEPYLAGSVVDRVSEIIREFEALHTEVSVVRYQAA